MDTTGVQNEIDRLLLARETSILVVPNQRGKIVLARNRREHFSRRLAEQGQATMMGDREMSSQIWITASRIIPLSPGAIAERFLRSLPPELTVMQIKREGMLERVDVREDEHTEFQRARSLGDL